MHTEVFLQLRGYRKAHDIDLSSLVSFEELTMHLIDLFGVADKNSSHLFDLEGSQILSLKTAQIADCIELRVTSHQPAREPPGPRLLPVVGNRYELYPDVLGNYDRLFSLYGPMIKTVNMGTTIYHTNDPEIARHVMREDKLFTKSTSDSSHPLHYMADQSCLFTCDSSSPAFTSSHKFVAATMSPRAIDHFTPLIQSASRSIFTAFDQLADSGLAANIYQYMFKLAAQIIWRVMLDQDLNHFESPNTPPSLPVGLFGQYLSLMKKMSMQPQWIKYIPFSGAEKLKKVRQQVLDITQEAMDSSVAKGGPSLSLSDPEAMNNASCIADFLYRASDDDGKVLSRDLVLSNLVVSCGAGFTTSSSLLSWALFSLVRYDGVQRRLFEEIAAHHNSGSDSEKAWTFDEIHGMKFLDCFVKEVLRLHSPSFQTARNAKQDVVLPGGYLIPKGSTVIACFPSIQKNPAHWDNPLRFYPDRWMEQGFAARQTSNGSYTPFAAGARGCVGFTLALTQVKIVLAELVYRYEFEDESPGPVVYDPEFLVVRPLNFYASMTRRNQMR